MGWLDSIIKVGAPVLGTVLGGPLGGAIGGAVAGGVDIYNTNKAANDAQNAQNDANAANEKRYREILALYGGQLERAKSLNQQISKQDILDINRSFDDLSSNTSASLGDRGLANTTIVPTVMSGITRERSAALTRANDERLQRTIKIEGDATGDLARAIERRTDNGPTDMDIAALAAAAGQAQTAMGGSLKEIIEQMTKKKPAGTSTDASSWLPKNLPNVFGSGAQAQSRKLI